MASIWRYQNVKQLNVTQNQVPLTTTKTLFIRKSRKFTGRTCNLCDESLLKQEQTVLNDYDAFEDNYDETFLKNKTEGNSPEKTNRLKQLKYILQEIRKVFFRICLM